MKQKILRIMTVIMIIATLTFSNFLFLGANIVSYAADAINANKSTNNKNVEFMAYFKNEKGEKISNIDVNTEEQSILMYLQIAVKQEGYFNGKISLKNANFNLKTNILSDEISKIENNTVYLKQINAGEEKEIQVEIELKKGEQFDLDYINLQSEVEIDGIYVNHTQKDISIKADRNVTLNFVNPENTAVLEQEVITNKVITYNGEEKRIVQLEVKSGLKNNAFPVKQTNIMLQAPKISDKYPEKTIVNSFKTLVTNGNTIDNNNWNYDEKTGIVNIVIENKEKENKVSWIKNGEDNFIITYVFDKDVEIKDEKLKISTEINVYDMKNTKINTESEITIGKEEKDTIVKSEIVQNEENIYKGKLYSGIDRTISYSDFININLAGATNKINVVEEEQKINENEVNSYYKTSTFNVNNIQNILGENGTIDIKDAKTSNVIKTINKNSEHDENGVIVITYPENVREISIVINNAENAGIIEVKNEKTIKNTDRTLFVNATEMVGKVNTIYGLEGKEVVTQQETETKINLLETETKADLILNKTEISTMTKNTIEIKAVLHSRDEKNELYKNPTVRIQLPSKIEKINVTSLNLVFEDELKISSAKLLDGNIIEIKLQGEQTQYKEEAIEGATIIINAEIETSKKLTSSEEKITMTYTNQNATNLENNGIVEKTLNIVSYMGVVTVNKIPDYQVEVVNNDGNKNADIQLSDGNKTVDVQGQIINNEEKQIQNVAILGNFPTENSVDGNNMKNTIVDGLNIAGIDTNRVKIYYTNNATATTDVSLTTNGWTENMIDGKLVKKYLVVIDKLDVTEEVDISYKVALPDSLDYNMNAKQAYVVYYNNQGAEQKVETDGLSLNTPKGAVIDTELKTLVSGNETNNVKENGILRYEINLENTGSEDVNNVVIKSKVPDGTTFVNSEELNTNKEVDNNTIMDNNKKDVEIVVDSLAQGQKITKTFEVKIDDNMSGKQIENSASVQYGEVEKQTNIVTTNVSDGTLETNLVSLDAENGIVKSGYQYRFMLYVTNHSNKEMKNVEAKINTNDIMKVSEMFYVDSDDKANIVQNDNKIKIEKIGAGETKEVSIYTYVGVFTSTETKDISLTATCTENKNEYKSNEINLKAQSDLSVSMETTSENVGGYVSVGDTIKYHVIIKNNGKETVKTITLNNWIANDVTLSKVLRNGTEISNDNYSITIDSNKNQKLLKIEENNLEANQTVEYDIEVVVNLLLGNKEAIEIPYQNSLNISAFELANSRVEHILQPEKSNSGDNGNNGNNNNGGNNSGNQTEETKIISGIAWLDENENGQKDSSEKLLDGITVRLLDISTNEFVKDENGNVVVATTNATGFYSFTNVKKGQYLVVFEYDTSKYILTVYKKDGVTEQNNSDVISKTMDIDGQEKNIAVTEVIKLEDANVANINLGLMNAKTYDLQLDKYISKVTIQNNKTVSNNYTDATLVKEEIDSKQLNGTTVVVEYTIRVTNKGDVTAYVKKIADYLSSDYKFNSELNSDWYQSGNDVYCTSLSNEKLEPGQSKDVKLTVIKTMTENNTGLINNTAEIVESYNELGLQDVNSTEGNKVKGENDMGSADLIISIKTGQIVATVFITIAIVALIGLAMFVIIKKQIINKRVI